jgi:sugar/nucleoside kinase (ribokinase family)
MKILGLGNALVDVLIQLENDDILQGINMERGAMDMVSEKQMKDIRKTQEHLSFVTQAGGSVCNTIRAISSLGTKCGYIGKIGNDDAGKFFKQALTNKGVTPYLEETSGLSGSCTVLISKDGERTMATYLGPAPNINPEFISEDILKEYDYIYIEGYLLVNEPLVRSTMKRAKEMGLKVALDLSNFNIVNTFKPLLDEIIPKYVDILFSNESEAEAYTGKKASEAIDILAEQVETAFITLGKHGALCGHNGHNIHVPAIAGEALDTTGAGDHFAAGVLYGKSVGATLEQSANIGSLLAGNVIGVVGAQIMDESWEKIKLKVEKILR